MTIYAQDGGNGYIIPVKSFLTSVGDDTPVGTFKTPEKYRLRLMIHDVYTQYATRLGAGLPILIHSIIYDAANPMTVWASTYNNMGIARSAGCIRLMSGDSKWVYDHCALGTTVQVYNSSVAGPFERYRTFCAGKDRVDRAETAALCRSAEEAGADIDRWDAVVCIG